MHGESHLLTGEVEVRILERGATIQSVRVDGVEVTLGCDSPEGYARQQAYLGAVAGRYANRIAGARFSLDGVEHRLSGNLHGGSDGFDKRIWSARPSDGGVTLELTSPDGDQGYPGELHAQARYAVTGAELHVDFEATTDRPTVVNLTSHAYWNLAGGGTIDDHLLEIAASRYTPVDDELIPTGAIESVAGTPFDFREARPIGGNDYDINFALDRAAAIRLTDPGSGRTLEIVTTQPGLQLYTGTHLGRTSPFPARAGVALETQAFPDAPNRPEFPSTVVRPGEVYRASTVFRFS
jgi:aldose 1-epimerase